MKKIFFLTVLSLFLFAQTSFAGGFYLKTIGELDVEGSALTQYWYTGTNVTFTGVAAASATITVTIDGVSGTTISDSSGNWSYSTNFTQGDHTVTFSTEGVSPYTFTLTIGEVPEGVGSISKSDLPQAGVATPTLIMFFVGVLLISAPFLVKKALSFRTSS